jgi:predicted small lipoprotein YifL
MNSTFGFPHMVSPRLALRAGMLAALVATAALGGCGVRSNLEAPPEAKANGTAAAPDAGDAGPNSAVKPKPHKPFILDGLIR